MMGRSSNKVKVDEEKGGISSAEESVAEFKWVTIISYHIISGRLLIVLLYEDLATVILIFTNAHVVLFV